MSEKEKIEMLEKELEESYALLNEYYREWQDEVAELQRTIKKLKEDM